MSTVTNELQIEIMHIVDDWGSTYKTPITLKYIAEVLDDQSRDNIKSSLRALIRRGYLRKASIRSKTASYVQLRGL